MNKTLTFSTGNRKIIELAHSHGLKNNQAIAFDLPAGYTCPCADNCKSFSDRESGKITDGDNCKFRCYAASIESAFTPTRKAHWRNFDALRKLKTVDDMANLILSELPKEIKIVRIHSSGDYFSKRYFRAWVKVAELRPDVKFFGYTKVLPYVNANKPDNFHLIYSYGGKMDSKVTCEPVAYVVKNIAEAIERGLHPACIDNPADDFDFIMSGKTFALCLHGTQPAKRG
jgi:hypothetical protein